MDPALEAAREYRRMASELLDMAAACDRLRQPLHAREARYLARLCIRA